MPTFKPTALIILLLLANTASGQLPAGLAYSGEAGWDAATGTLTFKTSGRMPEGMEEGRGTDTGASGSNILLSRGVRLSGHLHAGRTHGETMNPEPDPILKEVHAAKSAVAASYGHDLKKMFADLMRRQGQDGRQVISLPPRKTSAA